ncbi:DUF4236 domain-containing protein [Salipiger marinus]|uniref:DUF4236 domain-containing protein n=1 Tax=Salipiger marinus TaxID=555512 RepID=A0A1G8UR72_9RHOB|nr:DUF4236 domain-containing protein [Salipiger marinus]SDJ56154.1 Protein of unknown function [Salipiger marinus]
MAFRFFTRKTLFPGVTLNLSKSGPSISIGPRGLRHTIGPRGRRTTVGLPGSGLSYSVQHGKRRRATPAPEEPEEFTPAPPPLPDPALATAEEDRTFLRAIVALQVGDAEGLAPLDGLDAADAHWIKGMSAFRNERWTEACVRLSRSLRSPDLGMLCGRNGVSLRMEIPITPEITAHISPEPGSTALALAEAQQAAGDLRDALKTLKDLNGREPGDAVVAASLAEVAFELDDGRSMPMGRLVNLLRAARPDPEIAWAVWLQEARARTRSGDHAGAVQVYAKVRGHDAVPEDVSKLAWYEMALTYGEAGDRTRSRQELSGLYALDRDFADVGDRLRGRTTDT